MNLVWLVDWLWRNLEKKNCKIWVIDQIGINSYDSKIGLDQYLKEKYQFELWNGSGFSKTLNWDCWYLIMLSLTMATLSASFYELVSVGHHFLTLVPPSFQHCILLVKWRFSLCYPLDWDEIWTTDPRRASLHFDRWDLLF